jgi:metal-responsive CopG/Arc/MetJ family transcriptional regulator
MRQKKHKQQLSLGFTEMESLDELQRDTEAASRSEVMREALAIYTYAVDETKKGGEIIVRRPNGETSEPSFRGLQVVRKAFRR